MITYDIYIYTYLIIYDIYTAAVLWCFLCPHSRAFFWIGGIYEEQEGNWKGKWIDGSAWNFTKWVTERYHQPDNDRDEDCLQIQFSENAQNAAITLDLFVAKKSDQQPKVFLKITRLPARTSFVLISQFCFFLLELS